MFEEVTVNDDAATPPKLIAVTPVKLFPLIDKDDFENKRARVLELQGKRIKAKITPLSMRRLQLKNIGHFENLELDVSNRVICLIGENGTGKSTILRAILLG